MTTMILYDINDDETSYMFTVFFIDKNDELKYLVEKRWYDSDIFHRTLHYVEQVIDDGRNIADIDGFNYIASKRWQRIEE